jgi:hypothetical protein
MTYGFARFWAKPENFAVLEGKTAKLMRAI